MSDRKISFFIYPHPTRTPPSQQVEELPITCTWDHLNLQDHVKKVLKDDGKIDHVKSGKWFDFAEEPIPGMELFGLKRPKEVDIVQKEKNVNTGVVTYTPMKVKGADEAIAIHRGMTDPRYTNVQYWLSPGNEFPWNQLGDEPRLSKPDGEVQLNKAIELRNFIFPPRAAKFEKNDAESPDMCSKLCCANKKCLSFDFVETKDKKQNCTLYWHAEHQKVSEPVNPETGKREKRKTCRLIAEDSVRIEDNLPVLWAHIAETNELVPMHHPGDLPLHLLPSSAQVRTFTFLFTEKGKTIKTYPGLRTIKELGKVMEAFFGTGKRADKNFGRKRFLVEKVFTRCVLLCLGYNIHRSSLMRERCVWTRTFGKCVW